MVEMIRFVDLREQKVGGIFAFYDTVTDKFCTINGNQVWDSVMDFTEDVELSKDLNDEDKLETNFRFVSLMPTWVPSINDDD